MLTIRAPSITELEAAVQQLMEPGAASQLEELLKKGGSLNSSVMALREKLTSMASRVIDLFKLWDGNFDGQISREEFIRAMPFLGLQDCLTAEINGLFNVFDPDNSGQISFRELYRMLRREAKPAKKEVVNPSPGSMRPPVMVSDIADLRRDVKQEVLKMNLRTEFRDLVMSDKKKMSDQELLDDEEGIIYRLKAGKPKETSMWTTLPDAS